MLRTYARLISAIIDVDFSKMNPTIDNSPTITQYMIDADDIGCYSNQANDNVNLESNYGYFDDTDELKYFIQANFVDRNLYAKKVQKCFSKTYPTLA